MDRRPAIGCMRLSTRPERDDDAAIAVLHAALTAGVRLLDTADAYAHHTKDMGHNERLIARALSAWSGDAAEVRVATKGGLTRPRGKWVPDGRAKHLRAACEASLRNLGVDRIALYQLHAPDPRVPFRTSVRALAKLQREGLVERVGLCNVSVAQIEEARVLVDVASVQVSVSPFDDDAVRGGVAEYCVEQGIDLLAHRPLGGEKARARLQRDAAIADVAARCGAAPADVALAWLRSLAPNLIPLPGPTRIETAASCGSVLELDADELRRLDARYPAADIVRRPRLQRRPPDDAPGDVVIVMGLPGAGKSTAARPLEESGYLRLNRDREGGTLAKLVGLLDTALATGARRVVLDNTYPTRRRRNEVLETAWRHGVPVRCLWLQTDLEQARINAVRRMLDAHDRLLEPDELAAASRRDPNTFGPRAQHSYQRELEPPVAAEGFAAIEQVPFEPRPSAQGRLLLLDVAGVAGDLAGAELRETVQEHVAAGWAVAGYAWRPDDVDASDALAAQAGLTEGLGVDVTVHVCTHPGGPPVCWCRPPMPGLVVLALRKAAASPARSVLIGASANAERFAAACGMLYRDAATFGGDRP